MFKKKFLQILQALGFVDKAKNKQLTENDWKQIDEAFKKEFGKSMTEVMDETNKTEELEKERNSALELLNVSDSSDSQTSSGNDDENAEKEETSIVNGIKTIKDKLANVENSNKELKEKMEKMASTATLDTPLAVVSKKLHASGPGHTKTHLFGIEHPLFDMKDRWNKIARNPNEAKLSDPDEEEDLKAFTNATKKYSKSVAARYKFLKDNNLLGEVKKNASFNNDLTELEDAGLGDQYVVLRQDALIARILAIPTVYDLFPRRYGIHDRELMTIAYFDELSQAYQKGHVFKGGMKLRPEMGYVDDSMFKTEFGPMKEIERMYIGYLNTDGSDPMKWNMIEWQLLNMYKVLVNEQNTRVIRGCFVKPETGVAGSYLNAGTGLFYTLLRYIHENKLLTHSDAVYNDYTETTMLDAVTAFIDDVKQNPDDDFTLDNKFLYLNKRHVDWWKKCVRTKFGKDTDFTGPDSCLNIVPDSDVRIKWVPNMGSSKLMFIQEPGNLQALECIPGEMLAVSFDRAMELMHVWSTWKEGFSAFIVGKKFGTLAGLQSNNYSMQEIFMNHPASELAADATTADALANFWFVTGANAAQTALTDIENAKRGVVYVIEIGTAANATTIAKAAKFADITAAWTPTAVGDYIMVTLNSAGNFIELERAVAGVRTINVDAQPNIIGGRA